MAKETMSFNVPEKFSFIENFDETLRFFTIINLYLQQNCNKNISGVYFNFNQVKYITIDAIMYMLAFNFRKKSVFNVVFGMTLPKRDKPRKFIQNCGIHQFVEKGINHENDIPEYCIIRTSTFVDVDVLKIIYDYIVNRTNKLDSLSCSRLYNSLIEIVTNSVEHAYKNVNNSPNWYCFIEERGQFLKITFLDDGVGIVNSIFSKQKGSGEDLNLRFGNKKYSKSKSFIYRALNGEIIRENKQYINRGKGLPEIYQFLRNTEAINNFYIISNKESLSFIKSGRITIEAFKNLKYDFNGTLYYFEIRK